MQLQLEARLAPKAVSSGLTMKTDGSSTLVLVGVFSLLKTMATEMLILSPALVERTRIGSLRQVEIFTSSRTLLQEIASNQNQIVRELLNVTLTHNNNLV